MKYVTSLAAVIVVAGVALAHAQAPAVPTGYLTREKWPDAARILPAPPAAGSTREAQDQAVFVATRSLEGSARWSLAQADAPASPADMLRDFSCAMGVEMSPAKAPKLAALLGRAGLDGAAQIASVKSVFKRPRPYLITDGPICVPKSDKLAASPDYPSGHAAWGWVTGLILAELAPDRATPLLTRARAFGESRVVCGLHSPSAVEAGRTDGAALVAALHGEAQFRADLEAARAEVTALRQAAAAQSASCAAEAELVAKPVW